MQDIEQVCGGLELSDELKAHALAVYQLIAEAESDSHGVPVTQIHFHEVGTLDAVADVTAVCLLLEMLAPDKIMASPVHVGGGYVQCAHGVLAVPAPATAFILRDVPMCGGPVDSELCTPTGAALIKHFASEYGDLPPMKLAKAGYGMGKKDFEYANCVRVLLGETGEAGDVVTELSCNMDDITAEEIGFAMERLLEAGALDVYTQAIGMKKSRPGVMLTVMCREKDRDKMLELIFWHTSTLGVRENISRRYTLDRGIRTLHTELGEVRVKEAEGCGVKRRKYEYEDLAAIAREKHLSIEEVKETLNRL